MPDDEKDTRVPVTVLTGFLGSGKTTLQPYLQVYSAMHTPARGVVTAGLRGRGRGLLGLDWPLVLGQEEVDAASDHDERGDTTDGDAGDRACGEVVVVALGRRRRRREERHRGDRGR